MFAPKAFGSSLPKSKLKRSEVETQNQSEKTYSPAQSSPSRSSGWQPNAISKSKAQASAATVTLSEQPLTASRLLQGPRGQGAKHETHAREGSNQSHAAAEAPPSTPMAVPHQHGTNPTLPKSASTARAPLRNRSNPRNRRSRNAPSLPASVTALLETTTIPKRTSFPIPRSTYQPMSTQELMEEWSKDERYLGSSVDSSSNMDLLLSPPQWEDSLRRSDSSDSVDNLSRSTSSDSVPTLEPDESSNLSWSLPSNSRAIPSRRVRDKLYSLPQKISHDLDHPLSPPEFDAEEFSIPHLEGVISSPTTESDPKSSPSQTFPQTPRPRRPSSFKSNLTASLNSLRSSIRSSWSNFNAPTPYVLPEDHLYRGVFPPSYLSIQSEMRPRPFDGPVTPGMRRYMNPSSYHISSPAQDFHMHGHGRHIEHIDLEAAASAATWPGILDEPLPMLLDRDSIIPLQTYGKTRSSTNRPDPPGKSTNNTGNVSEAFTEAGRALNLTPDPKKPQYRRELRENGEFLRICILEMNMRRAGKLSDGHGRARLWLPPRVDNDRSSTSGDALDAVSNNEKVPKRWVAISA